MDGYHSILKVENSTVSHLYTVVITAGRIFMGICIGIISWLKGGGQGGRKRTSIFNKIPPTLKLIATVPGLHFLHIVGPWTYNYRLDIGARKLLLCVRCALRTHHPDLVLRQRLAVLQVLGSVNTFQHHSVYVRLLVQSLGSAPLGHLAGLNRGACRSEELALQRVSHWKLPGNVVDTVDPRQTVLTVSLVAVRIPGPSARLHKRRNCCLTSAGCWLSCDHGYGYATLDLDWISVHD
jgi:hypothetical protein